MKLLTLNVLFLALAGLTACAGEVYEKPERIVINEPRHCRCHKEPATYHYYYEHHERRLPEAVEAPPVPVLPRYEDQRPPVLRYKSEDSQGDEDEVIEERR